MWTNGSRARGGAMNDFMPKESKLVGRMPVSVQVNDLPDGSAQLWSEAYQVGVTITQVGLGDPDSIVAALHLLASTAFEKLYPGGAQRLVQVEMDRADFSTKPISIKPCSLDDSHLFWARREIERAFGVANEENYFR